MRDRVEFPRVIYGSDIKPQEEAGLKRFETLIIDTLLDHSLSPRSIWIQGINPGPRSLQLLVFYNDEPRPLFEIRAGKIDSLTEENLVSLINEKISIDKPGSHFSF